MRFATRCFLWSFVPVALLLTGTFWTVQTLTVSSVRNEVRSSLRQTQISMARLRLKSELQNSRFLKVVGDNAPLKAGMQLMADESGSEEARRTLEDQLREICQTLGFDFLIVSNSENVPLAAVLNSNGQLRAMDVTQVRPPERGFFSLGANTYR